MIIKEFYDMFDENTEEILSYYKLDDEFHYFEVGDRKVNVPKGTPGSSTSPVEKTENGEVHPWANCTSMTVFPKLNLGPKAPNPSRMGTEDFQKWLETASPSELEDFALSQDTGIFKSFYEKDLEDCARNLQKAVLSHKRPFFKRRKVTRILREFRDFVGILTKVHLELGSEGSMHFLRKNSSPVVESAEIFERQEVKDLLRKEWRDVSSTISVLQNLYLYIEGSDSALDPRSLYL